MSILRPVVAIRTGLIDERGEDGEDGEAPQHLPTLPGCPPQGHRGDRPHRRPVSGTSWRQPRWYQCQPVPTGGASLPETTTMIAGAARVDLESGGEVDTVY
jgi:hypothetical protein